VWVANIVCTSWVWVTNLICVGWVWVVNLVCVVWRWVVNTAWLAYCLAQYWICRLPELVMNAWLNCRAHVFVFGQCRQPRHTPPNPREKPGWTLTFEDDFTTGSLDPSKWIDLAYYGLRFGGSPPVNYYSPTSFSFGATTVSLLAEDVPITASGQLIPYQVGHIEWTAPLEQQHGYFEIRCRVPDTDEMWPAFWLASRHAWPPEIDIFEFYTNDRSSFESTQHWGVDTGSGHPKETRKHPVCLAGKLFHIYACEWKPGEIRWYYDNRLVRIATNGLSDFIHPMHVIVNNAVDARPGHFPQNSSYPNQFIVDYVRVYA
jgi:beta-glucanase (GH16 family)